MNIYPTLCELAGLPKPGHLDGHSMVPLLKDPKAEWKHPAITTHGFENHAIRKDHWRLIQYENGSLELYDHRKDPYEYTNLAKDLKYAEIIKALQKHLPKNAEPHDKSGRKR